MQSGTKTKSPVAKEAAVKLWEKLVAEKKAKGYHEGADAPAYTESDGTSKDTGLRPMLLTPATEEDVPGLLDSDEWGAQQKYNGKRILIRASKGAVVAANRRGLECIIPAEIAERLKAVNAVFDGELIGATYVPFDILEADGVDLRETNYAARHAALKGICYRAGLQPAPLAVSRTAKCKLFERLKSERAEGIVFKKLWRAPYAPGKVENLAKADAVKVKFYSSGEFVVTGWNSGKSSVALGAYDGSRLVSIGSVTVPAKDHAEIQVGGVIQVRYLYATPGHQLYQPTLDASSGASRRDDKKPSECVLSQLKYEGRE
jgi:bifunctional non-homologous end joining protein LigD